MKIFFYKSLMTCIPSSGSYRILFSLFQRPFPFPFLWYECYLTTTPVVARVQGQSGLLKLKTCSLYHENQRSVHPIAPVLLTKNCTLGTLICCEEVLQKYRFMILRIDISSSRTKTEGLDFQLLILYYRQCLDIFSSK